MLNYNIGRIKYQEDKLNVVKTYCGLIFFLESNELSFILISGNFQEIFLLLICKCNELNSSINIIFLLKCNIDISFLC